MTTYLYRANGQAVGYVEDAHVYNLNGKGLGQVRDTHVYRLDGRYVGELYKDMVVNRHQGIPGSAGSVNPGSRGARNPGNRGAVNYGYPDVFDDLLT